jgi:hypothetical protein
MLRAGRTQIGLNQDDWKKGIGVRLSISTTPGNVDEIAKRAKNAGINLKSEPHDTEWDNRAFEVSDPSGFLLTIFSETSAVGQLWVASPVEHVTRSLRRAPGNQAPSRAAREHALRSTQRIEVFPHYGPFVGVRAMDEGEHVIERGDCLLNVRPAGLRHRLDLHGSASRSAPCSSRRAARIRSISDAGGPGPARGDGRTCRAACPFSGCTF